jgi:hypothetical protein
MRDVSNGNIVEPNLLAPRGPACVERLENECTDERMVLPECTGAFGRMRPNKIVDLTALFLDLDTKKARIAVEVELILRAKTIAYPAPVTALAIRHYAFEKESFRRVRDAFGWLRRMPEQYSTCRKVQVRSTSRKGQSDIRMRPDSGAMASLSPIQLHDSKRSGWRKCRLTPSSAGLWRLRRRIR